VLCEIKQWAGVKYAKTIMKDSGSIELAHLKKKKKKKQRKVILAVW